MIEDNQSGTFDIVIHQGTFQINQLIYNQKLS